MILYGLVWAFIVFKSKQAKPLRSPKGYGLLPSRRPRRQMETSSDLKRPQGKPSKKNCY